MLFEPKCKALFQGFKDALVEILKSEVVDEVKLLPKGRRFKEKLTKVTAFELSVSVCVFVRVCTHMHIIHTYMV